MSFIQRKQKITSATIANGATASGEVALSGYAGGGYALPSTFDGTTLSFTVASASGGTFQALYDQYGNVVSLTVAASRSYALPAELFAWPFFKFVAGTAQSTTNTVIPIVLAG